MPDAMDKVQQLNIDRVSDALVRHADRPRPVGRETCANLDCGEAINAIRQQIGAQHCIDCAKAEEASAVHVRRWRDR